MSVKCPKCQHENPEDTLFCGKCATRLPSPEGIEVTETLETPKEELTTGYIFADRYQIIEELDCCKGTAYKYRRALRYLLPSEFPPKRETVRQQILDEYEVLED